MIKSPVWKRRIWHIGVRALMTQKQDVNRKKTVTQLILAVPVQLPEGKSRGRRRSPA